MPASILLTGGLTKPAYVKLTTTSTTDVYTATQTQERVISAMVCNDSGGAVTVKLTYTDTANAVDVIYWEKSVAANTAEIVDFPIRLRNGDKIKAVGNNNVNIVLAVLIDNGALGAFLGGAS